MNRDYGEWYFTSKDVIDLKEGYSGIELYGKSRINQGETRLVAKILFWDALIEPKRVSHHRQPSK